MLILCNTKIEYSKICIRKNTEKSYAVFIITQFKGILNFYSIYSIEFILREIA